jgi:hypothetical protein
VLAGSKCQKGHAGKWRSSASNLRPRHTKQRTGRISSGRELAQDWDCISLWATFYDSPISQVTLSDQSPTEGWPEGRPEGVSHAETGSKGPLVQWLACGPPFSLGGIAFQTFGNAVPRTQLVTVHSAGYCQAFSTSLIPTSPLQPPTLRRHSCLQLPRDRTIS